MRENADQNNSEYEHFSRSDGHPFSKHLFAVEIWKTEIKMNNPVYLGQAMLDLKETLMYEFH